MGLAGRKVKQRIGTDPRNLAWIDDSSKFGEKYLQSLGWSAGQGLGLTGEGRKDNIKIHQKLDLLGVGANRKGPGADDWRVGREYDKLLSRLNQTQDNPHLSNTSTLSGFNKASPEQSICADESQMTEKKRKRSLEVDSRKDKHEKKRKKKQRREEEKEAKRNTNSGKKEVEQLDFIVQNGVPDVEEPTLAAKGPLYRPHRKRHLASKRLAAASSQSMKEILGISTRVEDDSVKLSTATESIAATTMEKESTKDSETNLIRKNEKSMVDYFAEKLRLRKQNT